jgi:signal transduction histidine kinase
MLKALATIGESSAILAHEIKNPITALNVALRAVADKLGSEDREVVDDLAARLRKVEAMIRRTLSFTRPLDLKIERIAPKDLAAKVATALAPRLKQWPNVVFRQECRAKEPIEAADGARVRIRARCMDDGPDRVRFEVEDDGPGFADSVLSKVFLPFVTTKATGTGLGLAWCKKIVDEHGGSLTVHRVEPKGAMMRMLLPRTSLR